MRFTDLKQPSCRWCRINLTIFLARSNSSIILCYFEQDLTRPNAKNQLAAAARAVTESINHLVSLLERSTFSDGKAEGGYVKESGFFSVMLYDLV